MSELTAKAMLVLPLHVSKIEILRILKHQPWQHWTQGLTESEISDNRRFFNRACADIFRPKLNGRYHLDLSSTPLGQLSLAIDDSLFSCSHMTLMQLDDHIFLYMPISSEHVISDDACFKANRELFSIHPKTMSAQLPKWLNANNNEAPLLTHLEQLLGMSPNSLFNGCNDWFGHECPGIYFVNGIQEPNLQLNFASKLAAGELPNRSGYQASENRLYELKGKALNPWSDWACLHEHRKVVFVGQNATAVKTNIFDTAFYTDLFTLALLHRIKLQTFQELLTAAEHTQIEVLQKHVQTYRKTYRQVLASTYPLGQQLAEYFTENLQINHLEQRVFNEVHQLNEEVKRQQGERDNFLLFTISILAAVVLPLNTLSTVLSVDSDMRSVSFWLTAGFSTSAIIFIIMVARALHNKRKSKNTTKTINL